MGQKFQCGVRQHGMGLTTNRHKITCYFIFRTLNEENKRYLRLKSCLTAEDWLTVWNSWYVIVGRNVGRFKVVTLIIYLCFVLENWIWVIKWSHLEFWWEFFMNLWSLDDFTVICFFDDILAFMFLKKLTVQPFCKFQLEFGLK